MDCDREELVKIHGELNNLIERMEASNWKAEIKEPVITLLSEASVSLYRMRLKVHAAGPNDS